MITEPFLSQPKSLADTYIPNQYSRIPEDTTKTQQFYEFILVDTGSIIIQQTMDKIDPSKLSHCKIRICKIITKEQWGHPMQAKKFSQKYAPQQFTYWDYREAWFKAFLLQNQTNSMSWFFYFDKMFKPHIPNWFIEWWDKYGPTIQILPGKIQETYLHWKNNLVMPETYINTPEFLLFYSTQFLTWIYKFEYVIEDKLIGNIMVPYLCRQHKIKWWANATASLSKEQVAQWFLQNPQFGKGRIEPEQVQRTMITKSQLTAKLAAAKTDQEISQIMKQYLAESSSQTKSVSSNDSNSPPHLDDIYQDAQYPDF